MKKRPAAPLITIGATPSSIAAARAVILEICNTSTVPEVKVAALHALTALCKVENTTFTNCTFAAGK